MTDDDMNRAYDLLRDADILRERADLSDSEQARLDEACAFERDFPRLAEMIRLFGPTCYNGERLPSRLN